MPDVVGAAAGLEFQAAIQGQRKVVLGNLVAFHQVRIGVVLPVELRVFRNAATQGEAGHDGVFDGLTVDHRQGARKPEATPGRPFGWPGAVW